MHADNIKLNVPSFGVMTVHASNSLSNFTILALLQGIFIFYIKQTEISENFIQHRNCKEKSSFVLERDILFL